MRIRALNRNMRRSGGAQLSLTARAIAAIRRAGGTVLAAGAAVPVGPVNLLLYSADFAGVTWGKTYGGTGVAPIITMNATTAPDGKPAALVVLNKGAGTTSADQSRLYSVVAPSPVGAVFTHAHWVKTSDGSTKQISLRDDFAGVTSEVITVTPSWQLFAFSGTSGNGTQTNIGLWLRGTVGTSDSASLHYAAAGVFKGTWTAEQILAAGGIPRTGSIPDATGYTYGNPPVRNYFDSAGTDILDSVTQVDQPVGLTLDAAGTAVPIPTTTFAPYLATITSTSLPSTATNTGTSNYGFQIAGVYTSGKVYEYTVSWSGNTARRNLSVDGYGGVAIFSNAESGTATFTLKQGGANLYVYAISASTGESFTLNSIAVRELPGNHATQATVGSKPTLRRGLVNLLPNSGNISAWPDRAASTISTDVGIAQDGTMTADLFTKTAISGSWCDIGSYLSVGAGGNVGKTYTLAMYLYVASGTASCQLLISDRNYNTYSSGLINVTTTPQLFLFTSSGGAGWNASGSAIGGGIATPIGVGVYIGGAALYQGTVTAQQILAAGGIPLTTTAPASSALGNYWWQFDPAAPGDFFGTGVSTGNEGWVCAGVTPANTTTAMSIINAGEGTSTVPGIWLFSDGTGRWFASAAEGSSRTQQQTPMLGTTSQVLSMGWNLTTLTLGLNNVETSTPKVGAGSWSSGANTLRIGMYQGSSLPFNGAMPVTVICPTLPPPADRALIRAWVAKQQGQTL